MDTMVRDRKSGKPGVGNEHKDQGMAKQKAKAVSFYPASTHS